MSPLNSGCLCWDSLAAFSTISSMLHKRFRMESLPRCNLDKSLISLTNLVILRLLWLARFNHSTALATLPLASSFKLIFTELFKWWRGVPNSWPSFAMNSSMNFFASTAARRSASICWRYCFVFDCWTAWRMMASNTIKSWTGFWTKSFPPILKNSTRISLESSAVNMITGTSLWGVVSNSAKKSKPVPSGKW